MSWILEYFGVYLMCGYIYMFVRFCPATYCSVVSTLMLDLSHAIQNKKKLFKFTE